MDKLDQRSKDLRIKVIKMLEVNKRGHIGSAMSLVEILRVLYDSYIKYDSKNPDYEGRDRLILSKGHGCLSLYAILADKKFFEEKILSTYGNFDSLLGGHPEKKIPGVEACTGSLGHGLPIGTGLAMAFKIKKKNNKVIVIVGDGEINEGSNWEALLCASKHKLSNLILIIDYNKMQSYSYTSEVVELEPLADKFKSFNFNVYECDGHSIENIENTLNKLNLEGEKPNVIISHTIKGKGIKLAENNPEWHHKSKISIEEFKHMYESLK